MFYAKHFFLKQLILISILVFLFSGCKEEQLDMPGNFIVSQGSYPGVVHFSWDPVANAPHYNIDRQDPETGEWINAATSSGTDIYYAYGDGTNQTTWYAPRALKSVMLSKRNKK